MEDVHVIQSLSIPFFAFLSHSFLVMNLIEKELFLFLNLYSHSKKGWRLGFILYLTFKPRYFYLNFDDSEPDDVSPDDGFPEKKFGSSKFSSGYKYLYNS